LILLGGKSQAARFVFTPLLRVNVNILAAELPEACTSSIADAILAIFAQRIEKVKLARSRR